MTDDVTAQTWWDGTFSSDAVAAAAHALVQELHDEAMAAIASLAETWDSPVEDARGVDDGPVVYRDPATWSVEDDEDDQLVDDVDDEDDEVRVLPRIELPPVLPRPRPVPGNVTEPQTDRFLVEA